MEIVLNDPLLVESITNFLDNQSLLRCLRLNCVFNHFASRLIKYQTQTSARRLNFLFSLSTFSKTYQGKHQLFIRDLGLKIGQQSSNLIITSIFGNSLSLSLPFTDFKLDRIIKVHKSLTETKTQISFVQIKTNEKTYVIELDLTSLGFKSFINCYQMPAFSTKDRVCSYYHIINSLASIISHIKPFKIPLSWKFEVIRSNNLHHIYAIERNVLGGYVVVYRVKYGHLHKLLKIDLLLFTSCVVDDKWYVGFHRSEIYVYDLYCLSAEPKQIQYKPMSIPGYTLCQRITTLGKETILISRKQGLLMINCRTSKKRFIKRETSINWRSNSWSNDGSVVEFEKHKTFYCLNETQLWDMGNPY